VRVALGATRRSVVNLALVEALGPVLAGAVGGLLLAAAASRMLQALRFDMSSLDPLSVSGAVLVLVAAAAFAAWLPARRASGVDPVVALRQD
jgi:ABC-type antimicrobial peptide transport system permease subunit